MFTNMSAFQKSIDLDGLKLGLVEMDGCIPLETDVEGCGREGTCWRSELFEGRWGGESWTGIN